MNILDAKITSLTDELVIMKNINTEQAHLSVANLLNTDMSKASVIAFLKYAISLHKVAA